MKNHDDEHERAKQRDLKELERIRAGYLPAINWGGSLQGGSPIIRDGFTDASDLAAF